jgi:hypothetical protein
MSGVIGYNSRGDGYPPSASRYLAGYLFAFRNVFVGRR